MKMKNNLLFYILISTVLFSCTEVLVVDLPADDEKLVIEGLLTTQAKRFQVKLSKTKSLSTTDGYPAVDGATIVLADNVGNVDTLALLSTGVYQSKIAITGVVGRTYYLTVNVNGKSYIAEDKLLKVSPIDSLYAVYLKAGEEIGITEDGYYVFFNSSDPPTEKNYYIYNMFRNNLSVLDQTQIAVTDDRFFAPIIIGFRLPGKYSLGDKAKVELFSLSEGGFTFYNGLAAQLQSDGGFFSTPPANAISNFSNGALGFFQVSDVQVDSLFIK